MQVQKQAQQSTTDFETATYRNTGSCHSATILSVIAKPLHRRSARHFLTQNDYTRYSL